MPIKRRRASSTQQSYNGRRLLRHESLEDRRMLATQADIVFLVDESSSDTTNTNESIQEWLRALVTGDVDNNDTLGLGEVSLATKLANDGIDDVRYGLVGFGQFDRDSVPRHAHSQLFGSSTDSLFGDPTSATMSGPNDPFVNTAALNLIFGTDVDTQDPTDGNLTQFGGDEDGWDAIEHAIAEYDIRDGSVPVFVLVQNDEGRINLNSALERPGILAALRSKNAILNVIVPGESHEFPQGSNSYVHDPLFVVQGAPPGEYILGVEADQADGVVDQMHDYYGIVGTTPTTGRFNSAFGGDTIDGEPGGAVGETENSYVRLAWDTGGGAWDIGVTEDFQGVHTPQANELRDVFIASMINQINDARAIGKVFHDDSPLLEINLGGTATGSYSDDSTATLGVDIYPGVPTIRDQNSPSYSGAITAANGNSMDDDPSTLSVFNSAREAELGGDLDIDLPSTLVPDGTYFVELMFAETDSAVRGTTREFDVNIEGELLLDDYSIFDDYALITTFSGSMVELDTQILSRSAPIVRRFAVEVTGGLQINLENSNIGGAEIFRAPLLSGLRVLHPAELPALPGDYNRDGVVNASDYAVWRDSLGDSVWHYFGADGNGNGVIDTADYQIWASAYGASTGSILGDFNDNGSVDSLDYDVWYATNGNTVQAGTGADANEDGIVNSLDYDIWHDLFGSTMAVAQFGMLEPTNPDAPKVVGFALSNNGGASHDYATSVGSGEQLRSADAAGVDTVHITFSENVSTGAGDLELINLDGASPTGGITYSYNAASNTASFRFSQALVDGRYLLTLSDDANGSSGTLDGEFFNPWTLADTGTGIFPSGDGKEGGDFHFRFTILANDTDRDNIDGATDYTTWHTVENNTILVSTLADESDSDTSVGDTSLREALSLAAAQAGEQKIVFWNTLYQTNPATILLGDADGSGAIDSGETPVQLTIDSDLKIIGPGSDLLTISGGDAVRVIKATSGNTVTIAGVTIADGQSVGDGGGIYSEADLTLDYVTIRDNQAGTTGSPKWGGGVHAQSSDLTIHASTISDNVGYHGAGVAFKKQSGVHALRVERSTFSANYSSGAGRGGGLYIYDYTSTPSVSTIVNSTFSDNEANIAGSIGTNGTPIVNIYSSTITDNYSRQLVGGAHNNDNNSSGADITLHFSIIAGNTAAGSTASWDLDGPINSASSYNLIGYENGTGLTHGVNGNMIVGGANIGLTALGDHGGPTETHALLDGSMAIAAGDAAFAASLGIEIDQRGIERDGGLFIDLGAFQLGADEYYGTI